MHSDEVVFGGVCAILALGYLYLWYRNERGYREYLSEPENIHGFGPLK